MNNDMTLDEWIINGSVGISSKTMWAALKGLEINPNQGDIPHDPDDFSRCYKLVDQCFLTRNDLKKISNKLPYWTPFIDNWDELTSMYLNNVKNQWKTHKEIGMYEYMQELKKESYKILNG